MRDPFWWSFPIGSLFGIRMRLHWTMPLLVLGILGRNLMLESNTAWIDALWILSLFFFSVLLHELGHCLASSLVQGETNEIVLWPLGGMARADYLPHTPWAHFAFALGGPVMNAGLCLFALTGLALLGEVSYQPPWNPLWDPYRQTDGTLLLTSWSGEAVKTASPLIWFFAWLFYGNWILFIVNLLLPGLPFDGGQLLRAGLWPRFGYRQATFYAISAGLILSMVIAIVSVVSWEPLLLILTYFCYVSCKQEWLNLETGSEDSLFGYDFSQGYTSLEKDQPPPPRKREPNFIQRWLERRRARKLQQETERREAEERRMDELLAKIQDHGKESLTDEETRFLKRVSDRYRNKKS